MPKYGKWSDFANAYFLILSHFPELVPLWVTGWEFRSEVSVGECERDRCRSPGGYRHAGTDGDR